MTIKKCAHLHDLFKTRYTFVLFTMYESVEQDVKCYRVDLISMKIKIH